MVDTAYRVWGVRIAAVVLVLAVFAVDARAQGGSVSGTVRDESSSILPGILVELRQGTAAFRETVTDDRGAYRFDAVSPGQYVLSLSLVNFAPVRREIEVTGTGVQQNVVMYLSFNADVVVTGKTTFTNLADAAHPAENLVGIARSASQGAITSRQLDARPMMRTGEILETVPGVIISQHSGEGKANQYYLRGFNLDHGTDFATTVAGMPVNMPTHGHGHGYSDLNFMIPELVSGVQYSKGPYFADQGDFATAGAANINYVNSLGDKLVRVSGGGQGFARAVAAASMDAGGGQLLGAVELGHNDGPWDRSDDYRKFNGLVRYTRGDTVNGYSLTAMGYDADWNSTDQVPQRAIESGLIGRFGNLDPSDGGDSYRYSGTFEWQRSRGNASTKAVAFGIGYDLNLFSNFTFFLDDPENGDQFHQRDHRFVSGGKVTHRRVNHWKRFDSENSFGVQLRNDNISTVGLFRTVARERLDTVRQDDVMQTSVAGFAQNETEWAPWLRTVAGVRVDRYRFDVNASDPLNSGVETDALASPKGGVILGPWQGTELYVNGGFGFHSNDARGATITRDPVTGEPAERVTPLARVKGAEVGFRTVAVPHLQLTATLWSLSLDSELIFIGDAGSTEAGRPSHRYGVELASYYSPKPWLTVDFDATFSNAHFTDEDPAGDHIPGAIETAISGGITVDALRNLFGSLRLRYFGSRPLLEDNSIRSEPTALVNLEAGYKLTSRIKVAVDIFNLFNAKDSDIDYYYTSRLPGEPDEGIAGIHLHPTLPRTARLSLIVGF